MQQEDANVEELEKYLEKLRKQQLENLKVIEKRLRTEWINELEATKADTAKRLTHLKIS